jgi:hypothetical protein
MWKTDKKRLTKSRGGVKYGKTFWRKNMKKKFTALCLLLALLCAFGLAACGEDSKYADCAGKYYRYINDVKDMNSWFDLKADGTYTNSDSLSGSYTISEDEWNNARQITLTISGFGDLPGTIWAESKWDKNGQKIFEGCILTIDSVPTFQPVKYRRDMPIYQYSGNVVTGLTIEGLTQFGDTFSVLNIPDVVGGIRVVAIRNSVRTGFSGTINKPSGIVWVD